MCEMSFAPLKSSCLSIWALTLHQGGLEKLLRTSMVAGSDSSLRLPQRSSFLRFILPFSVQRPGKTNKWIKKILKNVCLTQKNIPSSLQPGFFLENVDRPRRLHVLRSRSSTQSFSFSASGLVFYLCVLPTTAQTDCRLQKCPQRKNQTSSPKIYTLSPGLERLQWEGGFAVEGFCVSLRVIRGDK